MSIFKNIILGLLLLIFAVLGSVFIVGKGLEQTALQTSFYKNVIQETNISSQVLEGIVSGIQSQTLSGIEQLSEEQRQSIRESVEVSFSRAFNKEWMEETTLTIIDDALSYLKGEQDQLTAVIDLEDRKQIIIEELEKEIEKSIQIPERATPGIRQQVEAQKSSIKNQLLENFPDKIAMADLLEKNPQSAQIKTAVEAFQWGYSYFNPVFYAALIVLAIIMLVIAGIKSGLKWVGAGMIISGVVVAGGLLGGEQFLSSWMERTIQGLTWEKISPITIPIFNKIYVLASIYAVIGVLLLAANIFIKKPQS